jgi:hypothetical protein
MESNIELTWVVLDKNDRKITRFIIDNAAFLEYNMYYGN